MKQFVVHLTLSQSGCRSMIRILVATFLFSGICSVNAQQLNESVPPLRELDLPKVFLIGEYEDQYGLLYEVYHDLLLSVCHDDMNLAFDKWMHMLADMEAYANDIDFNLNGVKVWLKVFWDEDGSIRYLSYYLKPNSLNINTSELSAFFTSFINRYQMPIETNLKYTHNGSAQFPTSLTPMETRRN